MWLSEKEIKYARIENKTSLRYAEMDECSRYNCIYIYERIRSAAIGHEKTHKKIWRKKQVMGKSNT